MAGIARTSAPSAGSDPLARSHAARAGQAALAIPKDEWPLAVKAVAMLARPEDRGVGDIVERMANLAGGKALAQWYKELTGSDCGCANRKDRLNRMYPLQKTPAL